MTFIQKNIQRFQKNYICKLRQGLHLWQICLQLSRNDYIAVFTTSDAVKSDRPVNGLPLSTFVSIKLVLK